MKQARALIAITLPAAFSAMIAASAIVRVPIGVFGIPIVVQNMVVVLAGLCLGPGSSFMAVAAFLALGAIGLPVFSGGNGGLAYFIGPTGGYLVGYLIAAPVAGLAIRVLEGKETAGNSPVKRVLCFAIAAVAGFLAIYPTGIAWLSFKSGAGLVESTIGSLPFMALDAVKAFIVVPLSMRLRPLSRSLVDRYGTDDGR